MGRNKPKTKKRGKIPKTPDQIPKNSDHNREREIKLIRALLDTSSPVLDLWFPDGSPNPDAAKKWHETQVKEYSKTSFQNGLMKELTQFYQEIKQSSRFHIQVR